MVDNKEGYTPEADGKLYLVSRRHVESNEVIFDTPVKICTECGIVYVQKMYRLGQCPLKHDQKRPNKEDYSLT